MTQKKSGKIKFICVLLEEKTWTQKNILRKLTLVAYSIAAKRDPFNKKQSLCTSIIPKYPC